MNQLKISKRKITKSGKKSATGEFIGTFIKANGEHRTMHFSASVNKVPEYQRNGTLATVYDCERKGIRRFNFGRVIGQVMAVN